jgi:PKD repeat protein
VAGFTYQQNLDELYEINFTNTSQNATSYLWNFGGGNTSTEENPTFSFSFDNTWPVSLVVSNTCGSDTIETGVVVIKTSLEDIDGMEVNVLQLPDGSLQINGNLDVAQVLTLDIMALNGQLLWHGSTGKSNVVNIQVPVLDGAEGLYFIRIQSGDKARIIRYLGQ